MNIDEGWKDGNPGQVGSEVTSSNKSPLEELIEGQTLNRVAREGFVVREFIPQVRYLGGRVEGEFK